MARNRYRKYILTGTAGLWLVAAGQRQAVAADTAGAGANVSSLQTSAVSELEITQLRQLLAEQQRQIDELRRGLARPTSESDGTAKMATERAANPTGPAIAATRLPAMTAVPLASIAASGAAPVPVPLPQSSGGASASAPLQFRLGDTYFTPVGFMDMTSVSRSTNTGSGIGTNFGSIPYGNTQAGSLTESRLSPQNSRLGMRIDAPAGSFDVTGYWESDFLGQLGAPPNGGLSVSSNPFVFRMRLYWVDVRKNKFEFLAGQSWSLMTPNRKGVSPLPGDVFYSQNVDVNYQVGLTWGRIPGFRMAYHLNDKVAMALALENSEPYVGGANGGSAVTGPAAIYGTANAVSGAVLGGQINNGASVISAAALHPDMIAKVAFDPNGKFHGEVVALEVTNKVSDPASVPAYASHTKAGGGLAVNLSFEIYKNIRILTNNFYSAGGGRYIFGQAPDFMIRADGSLSLIHSASTVTGIEAALGRTAVYGYYGAVYIARNMALDANGKTPIGYGPISSDGQNRTIQEITFGTNTTLAKDPHWGALNLMFQYSYLQRNPWLAAVGAPVNARLSMGFVNLRFTLPGTAPGIRKR